MPQPTRPASVRIVQYCPLCQRLLMPMAQPFLNWIGREIVRGSASLMASLRMLRRVANRVRSATLEVIWTSLRSRGKGRDMRRSLGLMVLVILVGSGRAEPPKKVDFAHDIVPLLKARCAECHTNGKYKGSFSLDTRGDVLRKKAVVPGKSADSEIIKRVTSTDKDVRMPAKGEPLSAKEVALLRAWIDEGFAWEDGFSFKGSGYVPPLKPRRPTLPAARDGHDHPIDRIIDAYL